MNHHEGGKQQPADVQLSPDGAWSVAVRPLHVITDLAT